VTLFFCGVWLLSSAQSNSVDIEELKALFRRGNYWNAYVLSSEMLERDSSLTEVWYIKGESAVELFLYDKAYDAFKRIIQFGKENDFPDLFYELAEVCRALEKYEEGLVYYIFYELKTDDRKTQDKLQKTMYYIAHKDSLMRLVHSYDSTIEVSHLPIPVNTPYSEFAPCERNDSLFFTSIRPLYEKNPEHLLDNDFFSSLYLVKFGAFGYKKPERLSYPFSDKNKHVANIAFNEDASEAWFNLCELTASSKFRCDLYSIKKISSNKWSRPKYLPFNLYGYTTTQPAYARDSLNREVLFFSSDRPGGYGGMDIWYVVKNGDEYSYPINVGSLINSPGNEITPFYDVQGKTLYFSSDYWIGLGGYDIFCSRGMYNQWEKPRNLLSPMNSSAHDVYFILSADRDYGYFTSNRKGSFALKGETCCYDLYSFYQLPKVQEPDTLLTQKPEEVNMLKDRITGLLPINLYFHNDYPDPRSHDSLTSSTYQENYEYYLSLEEKYIKEYSKGLTGEDKEKARVDMEDFFTREVSGNYQKLLEFLSLMLEDLRNGSQVILTIQGFTSPLTTTEYNLNLAKRRIKSVVNFLKEYQQGVFLPYMEGDTPVLRIVEKPVGEVLADTTVSDNPHDVRKSIYSIKASKERRVQLASYQSTFTVKSSRDVVPIAHFSTHDLMIFSEKDSCKEISIINEGNAPLEIKRVLTSQPWVTFSLKNEHLQPNEKTSLAVCVDVNQLQKMKLAILFLETNQKQASTEVIYIRSAK